jgi:hypothetical protein
MQWYDRYEREIQVNRRCQLLGPKRLLVADVSSGKVGA